MAISAACLLSLHALLVSPKIFVLARQIDQFTSYGDLQALYNRKHTNCRILWQKNLWQIVQYWTCQTRLSNGRYRIFHVNTETSILLIVDNYLFEVNLWSVRILSIPSYFPEISSSSFSSWSYQKSMDRFRWNPSERIPIRLSFFLNNRTSLFSWNHASYSITRFLPSLVTSEISRILLHSCLHQMNSKHC